MDYQLLHVLAEDRGMARFTNPNELDKDLAASSI